MSELESQRMARMLATAIDSPGVTIKDGNLRMRAGNRIFSPALAAKLAHPRENQP